MLAIAGIALLLGQTTDGIIKPPDILVVRVLELRVKESHRLEPGDFVRVILRDRGLDPAVEEVCQVGEEGQIDVESADLRVSIVGLTAADASRAVQDALRALKSSQSGSVQIEQPFTKQLLSGEHLVGPDGSVNLGLLGSVRVAGLTTEEAPIAIERHLANHFDKLQLSVEIFGYSQSYYILLCYPEDVRDKIVVRMPYFGAVTVQDALSHLGGNLRERTTCVWIERSIGDRAKILPVVLQGMSVVVDPEVRPHDKVHVTLGRWPGWMVPLCLAASVPLG